MKSKNIKTLLVEDRSLNEYNTNVNNEWGLQQEFIKKLRKKSMSMIEKQHICLEANKNLIQKVVFDTLEMQAR